MSACILVGMIQQDASYHLFADPAGSLVSNLAFALVAAWGLRQWPRLNAYRRLAYLGCLLVAMGSAWYHAQPSDQSLVWDRLPMTLVFAAVFTEALAVFRSERLARRIFLPLIALGLGSVVWWQATGDLTPYAVVQFGPMLAIPMLILTRQKAMATRHWWAMLGLYCIAKMLEAGDVPVFVLTQGLVGGHTLKHVVAAAALLAWQREAAIDAQARASDVGGIA